MIDFSAPLWMPAKPAIALAASMEELARTKKSWRGMLPGMVPVVVTAAKTEFVENFGGFVPSAGLPTGFTSIWEHPNTTFAIQNAAVGGSISGKELKVASGAATVNFWLGISFNPPGQAADAEVLARGYAVAATNNVENHGVALRMSDLANTGYGFRLYTSSGGVQSEAVLSRLVAGVHTPLGNESFAWDLNVRYYFRLRAIGTSLKAKVWEVGDPEPATWLIEVTDSGITAAGFAGLTQRSRSTSSAFDYIAVTLGGGTAPLPA